MKAPICKEGYCRKSYNSVLYQSLIKPNSNYVLITDNKN